MALWFYQTPPEAADLSEQLVANALSRLPDSWRIRWGYFYQEDPNSVDREGDFVVQGPDGHICVIEVKGTQLRQFVLTGHWDHGDGKEHPLVQLGRERKAIVAACETFGEPGGLPWIHGALALPNVPLLPGDQAGGELHDDQLISHRDLDDFPAWWARHIGTRQQRCPNPPELFHKAIAPAMRPTQVRLFLKRTDQIFNRFKNQEYELLQMLEDNRQLVVEGGAGTGKTFMALRLAQRLASEGDGHNVLFLCYNLLLGENLKTLAAKLKLPHGSVTVMTWEDLATELLRSQGIESDAPEERADRQAYYEIEMPGLVLEALDSGPPALQFDALVVDEAQDLDTGFPKELADAPPHGWWHILFTLLREGSASPMALFLDPAQRPSFRTGPFAFDAIFATLSQPARVRLRRTVRYTRQIHAYLQTLRCEATAQLIDRFEPHPQSPVGPEVEQVSIHDPKTTAEAITAIVRSWRQRGLCNPDDILILGPRRFLAHSSLGAVTTVGPYPIENYQTDQPHSGTLAYLGLHAAKGLDALAVILIDLPPFDPANSDPTAHFLAASRARQLLAVVTTGAIDPGEKS